MLCKLINANNQLSSGGLFNRFATNTRVSQIVVYGSLGEVWFCRLGVFQYLGCVMKIIKQSKYNLLFKLI